MSTSPRYRILSPLVFAGLGLSSHLVHAARIEHATVKTVDGERSYLLARPAANFPGPRPLVILLHGHGGSAEHTLGLARAASPLSRWIPIADREGLILAALDGASDGDGKKGWNDCRNDAPGNPSTDDVAFARAVIARLRAGSEIDATRIYAMGMSNGAMMTYRLAIELDTPLAAFTAVSGGMAQNSECRPISRATSALIIHGTHDPIVPYAGGEITIFGAKRGKLISVDDAVTTWRQRAQLPATPFSTTAVPHRDTLDRTRATLTVYGSDPAGLQVELASIEQGGHVEPSLDQRIGAGYRLIVGAQNHDLESAELAWSFMSPKRAQP